MVIIWNHGNFAKQKYRLNPLVHKIFSQDYWRGTVLVMFGPLVAANTPTKLRDFKVGDMKHIRKALQDFHKQGLPA